MATAFPSGRASLDVKLADVRDAVAAGADEVDMVIDRGAFLSGRYGLVLEEVQAVKEACGQAHLKVILETGELVTYDNVRRASYLPWWAAPTSSRPRPARSARLRPFRSPLSCWRRCATSPSSPGRVSA